MARAVKLEKFEHLLQTATVVCGRVEIVVKSMRSGRVENRVIYVLKAAEDYHLSATPAAK